MKQIKKVIAYSLFLVTATFVSCKKDVSSGERNQSPVANAGADQTITLPNDSLTLDGSASTDPDGSIASYKWTQIAGAVSSNIIKPELPNTLVRGLAIGVYRFELTVTDNGGLTARDSLWVTVQPNTLTASLQWQRAVGGTRADIAQCIQPTADGGYILAGNTNSQDGDIMGYHPGPYGCYLSCFNQTICGYFPDGLVVKLNNTGAIEWQNAIGGTAADNLLYIQSTADGGYIASGITYSNDGDVSGHHAGHSGGPSFG